MEQKYPLLSVVFVNYQHDQPVSGVRPAVSALSVYHQGYQGL